MSRGVGGVVDSDTSRNPTAIAASTATDATSTKAAFRGRWENTDISEYELRVSALCNVIIHAVPTVFTGTNKLGSSAPAILHRIRTRFSLHPSIRQAKAAAFGIDESSNRRCR